MTEEKLTKTILAWLEATGWEILAFDFPQSGTGVMLHPDVADRTHKNSGAIIPDIIAMKTEQVVVFENKNRFAASDFDKIKIAKAGSIYNAPLTKLLRNNSLEHIYWGIGMPLSKSNQKKVFSALSDKIDFVVFVDEEGNITTTGQQSGIFTNFNK